MLSGHLLLQKGNCETTRNYFLLCVILWVQYTFRNLDCNYGEKRLIGSHIHYWKKNIEMYIEEVVLEYVDCISLALNGDQ
jgi:hypothetical protein